MKNIITIILFSLSLSLFGQTEKYFDKYNVQSVTVNSHKFTVGDTLTFAKGTAINGEFLCTQLTPVRFLNARQTPPHLPALYGGYRFIIIKIREIKQGLNSQVTIVIDLGKNTPVWIDVALALTNNELLLK